MCARDTHATTRRYLRRKEAAEYLRISPTTLDAHKYEWRRAIELYLQRNKQQPRPLCFRIGRRWELYDRELLDLVPVVCG